jgi:hypothetical protein
MLDYHQSLSIAQALGWDYEEQCCWINAVQCLRRYYKRPGQALYVEGWVSIPDLQFVQEHGWIELEAGTILDPTYVRVSHDHHEDRWREHLYFPAVRYTLEELKGIRRSSLPRIWQTGGFGGLQNQAYVAAMQAAYESIGRGIPGADKQKASDEME